MGKGGSTTETTTTQDVPDWAKPYYTDILGKSKAMSEEAYVPFTGQRIAGDSGDLSTSQEMIRNNAAQGGAGFDQAAGTLGGLGSLAGQLGQQQPSEFSAFDGFEAGVATPYAGFSEFGGAKEFGGAREFAGANEFGFDPTRQFDGATATQYMSPYMDSVVNRQQEDAYTQFERARAGRDAQAVSAGAFGGSRQAVQDGIASEALSTQLGDIQASGSQRAFEQAQQQFERDRSAGMTTEQSRAAEAARVQGIGVGEGARVQGIGVDDAARVQGVNASELGRVQAGNAAELGRTQAINIDEQARVQAGNAAEAARVQGATADEAMRQREFQLQTAGFSADMAKDMASLQERAEQGDIQAAQLLEAQGLGNMARDQAGLDMGYQDFLRQQNFPRQQLADQSALLRGMPVAAAGSTTVETPYNPMQQALGAGISGLGLYKGMQ
jgi:hypothetical protein